MLRNTPFSGNETNSKADVAELFARLATINNAVRELSKEVVYLNGIIWAQHKELNEHLGDGP